MTVLDKLASAQNRRDEVPNQLLAKQLARTKNARDIQELAANLWNKDKRIAFDCIKTLYEICYIDPHLIHGYARDFLKLLHSRENRMVWGAMLALGTIAPLAADEIFAHYADVVRAMERGSVITVDNAVKTLALVAAQKDAYRSKLFPILLKHIETCRPRSVAQHSEHTLATIDARNKKRFIAALEKRMDILTSTQQARVRRVMREAEKR